MKKASSYIFSVIFTLLLIFLIVGAMTAGVFRYYALKTDTPLSIVRSQTLAERVHISLETTMRQQESTTGIPASLYADAIKAEKLEPIISDTISSGFAYLRGDAASYSVNADFSELEQSIRDFFSEYAETNHVNKDDNYNEAVRSTINSVEQTILSACDVYRFGSLNDAGVIKQLRNYLPWAGVAAVALIAAVLLFVLLVFFANMHEAEMGLYWTGTALLIASLLVLIPTFWVQHTRWFDRFSVKTDQTFAAVTGYLYANTHMLIVTALCGIGIAVLCYVIFVPVHQNRKHHETARRAKH